MTTPPPVTKPCEWNRYCGWVGPFHPGRILQVRMSRPALVGRCYKCEGFVCNRCARRRLARHLPPAASIWALELCCPLDGELLGRENDWRIVGVAGQVIVGSSELPSLALFCQGLAQGSRDREDEERVGRALELHQGARDVEALGVLDTLRDASPFRSLSLLVRKRALERLKRFDDAWNVQRTLLAVEPDSLLVSVGQLSLFTGPGLDEMAHELQTLVGDRTTDFLKRLVDEAARALTPKESPGPMIEGAPPASPTREVRGARTTVPLLAAAMSDEAFAAIVREARTIYAPGAPEDPAGLVERCASRPDVRALGETLAFECFRKRVEVGAVDELVAALGEPVAGFREAKRTLAEAASRCPFFTTSPSAEIGFRHPLFFDYFLARVLEGRLFEEEKPDFKAVGAAGITQNTARFLSEAIATRAERLGRVDEWLAMKRQRRSLFRGADIPVFVRNLALVRLMATGAARGIDLSEADFSDLDLQGADFTESVLTGATFRNTKLRGATFRGAQTAGVDFERADLEGAVLEKNS